MLPAPAIRGSCGGGKPVINDLRERIVVTRAGAAGAVARLVFALAGVLVVAASLLGATSVAVAASPPDLDALRASVLTEVNASRAVASVAAVVQDPALDLAAQAHAEYLVANGALWGSGLSAHDERADLPGFYAVKPSDRVWKAGFAHTKVMEEVLRLQTPAVVLSSPWTAEQIVAGWVDAPLHRRGVLDQSVLQVGFGYATDGEYHAYVLESAQDHLITPHLSAVQPYPADGQSDVPLSWVGGESPEPFPGLDYPCGYPITVFPIHGGSEFLSASLALTRAADGAAVEVVQSPARNIAFAPVAPLEPGVAYRASFTYSMQNEYTLVPSPGSLVWTFTAAGDPSPGTTTTTLPTTTTTLQPPTTTTTVAPSVFADVSSTDPYYVAIRSMALRGFIDGYLSDVGVRTFRPTLPVARQQFAKMIARSLQLEVTEADVCPFGDVTRTGAESLYPDNFVAVVADRGITRGTSVSPPLFSPWRSISRAQVITMVARAATAELPGRFVAPPAGYVGTLSYADPVHGENIRWAEYNGLLAGIGLRGWDVWAGCSRGEVAQILWNLVK